MMLGLPEWAYSPAIILFCIVLACCGWDSNRRGGDDDE